jgi:arylsulfatase A-like enzyme
MPEHTIKNVLFLMTDQQRRDSLGCYGNSYTQTPNLDTLARRGCRLGRNYVANPICMPNRLSLMSGRGGRCVLQRAEQCH